MRGARPACAFLLTTPLTKTGLIAGSRIFLNLPSQAGRAGLSPSDMDRSEV